MKKNKLCFSYYVEILPKTQPRSCMDKKTVKFARENINHDHMATRQRTRKFKMVMVMTKVKTQGKTHEIEGRLIAIKLGTKHVIHQKLANFL